MATAKRRNTAKTKRNWPRVLLLVVVLVAAAGWYWRVPIAGLSGAGAAYGAHQACSCVHIGGRDLGSCKDDFDGDMAAVFFSEDADARSVTARVPLIASETATFREGQGCVLETWRD